MFLTIALLLPFLTGQVPQIGNMLCPMHIPAFICGMVCGWQWGAVVGFAAPLLRFLIFGMPPIFPTGVAMAFELAAYGAVSGLLYKLLPKKNIYIYINLLCAMLAGRLVWGAVSFAVAGLAKSEFSFAAFWAGAVVNALPGIALHILLIPPIVMAMRKAGIILNDNSSKKSA